jgi:hypothetical protein
LSWWRFNERSLHNSPRLRLKATLSLFNTPIQNAWLTVAPSGYKFKVNDKPDVEKAYEHCCDLRLWHPWPVWPG